MSGKIHYALSGGESIGYARAITNLANVLCDSNYDETELEYYEIALKIMLKLFGNDHEESALTHQNVSYCLRALTHYDEARLHVEEAIRIRERVYGTAHVAHSLRLLGDILVSQLQFDEALRVLERSFIEQRSVMIKLNNIGNLY